MAFLFGESFDTYNTIQELTTKWGSVAGGPPVFASPGRLGGGQYLSTTLNGATVLRNLSTPLVSMVCGWAQYLNTASPPGGSLWAFTDHNGVVLGNVIITATNQVGYQVPGGGGTYLSAPAAIQLQAWAYVEVQVVFSATTSGSVTVRVNGSSVLTQGSVVTAVNGNLCAAAGPSTPAGIGFPTFYDDVYMLSLVAPNATFLGDTKAIALMPAGNGRVNSFSRVGGTTSGNYTAVNEIPPDGDTSYVYTNVIGTEDCYTLQTLNNVSNVLAVQLSAYVRKDDTPSRTIALGFGNGSSEVYDAGHPVNTTYTYITSPFDFNPITTAPWTVGDFSTLQTCIQLLS